MSQYIQKFERDCVLAGVSPVEALRRAGIHASLWWKWRANKVSPTLKNFEAAEAGLESLILERGHSARVTTSHGEDAEGTLNAADLSGVAV